MRPQILKRDNFQACVYEQLENKCELGNFLGHFLLLSKKTVLFLACFQLIFQPCNLCSLSHFEFVYLFSRPPCLGSLNLDATPGQMPQGYDL